MQSEQYSVLVITKDNKISSTIGAMLMPPMFDVSMSSDYNEARRINAERTFNIIIVDEGDGSGIDFAKDVSGSNSTILLLTSAEHFDQISYQVEGYGVLTITKPFDSFYFYNMIKIAIAVQYKIQMLSSQTAKLKEKMEEIRIVNRAKMLLMQNLNMTEQESHRYIEKEAMDRCIKRTAVAEQIIKTYN